MEKVAKSTKQQNNYLVPDLEDLRHEFYDPFYGYPNLSYFDFLLVKYEVFAVKKYLYVKNFEYCSFSKLFPDQHMSSHMENHLRDYKHALEFALFKLFQFMKTCDGHCIATQDISYSGGQDFRTDLAVKNNTGKVILAIEVGTTQICKIMNCLLHLPPLREIWHFPDMDYYFVWSRGRNIDLLPLLTQLREGLEEVKKYEFVRELWDSI